MRPLLRALPVWAALLGAALTGAASPASAQKPVPTRVAQTANGGWQLLRDGKPYFVKGAGGQDHLGLLAASGGNSIRTWGADKAAPLLDQAQKHGLTVTVGMWLGHNEHGFHYDDPAQVAAQLAECRTYVDKYRNHPALLMWAVGNEMEGDGRDPNVWKAVEDIARMIKRIDPKHPTMTVIAEIGAKGVKARNVAALCPDIDILGVNSYGGAASLPQRLKAAHWTKPYIVTEFGPSGPWEVGKTAWGAALEPTSTEKARLYRERYEAAISSQPGWCLGSYVFLWGHKDEGTPTWFGLFLPGTEEKLGVVDTMTALWSGKPPAAPAPKIVRFESGAAARSRVAPGSSQTIACEARGGKGPLTYRYEIRPEHGPAVPVTPGKDGSFAAPEKEGPYRLFVYVRDSANAAAATANLPFFVARP